MWLLLVVLVLVSIPRRADHQLFVSTHLLQQQQFVALCTQLCWRVATTRRQLLNKAQHHGGQGAMDEHGWTGWLGLYCGCRRVAQARALASRACLLLV